MSNIVHSNKNNNRDNSSVRGLQRAVDEIFDSFFTGWGSEPSRSLLLPINIKVEKKLLFY